jgi:hypothetical protein
VGGRNADSTTVDHVTVQSLNAIILTPERISQVPEIEYHKDTCKREAGYFFVAHSVYIYKGHVHATGYKMTQFW